MSQITERYIQNARKLGRNDPCWCGSGQKFKKCHLERERQTPSSRQEALKRFRHLQTRPRCYHPETANDRCGKNAVAAHTVPVVVLKQIARSGHVYTFPKSLGALAKAGGSLRPQLVGINKASTFSIFCSKHDSALFAPVETNDVRACEEHAFLLSFRALAYELFAKEAAVLSDLHRRELDKGLPQFVQVVMQEQFSKMKTGFDAALRDLQQTKSELDRMFVNADFSGMEYCVFWFSDVPDLMCCTSGTPSFDFQAARLQNLRDIEARMQILSLSVLGSRHRGCAFFAWTKGNGPVSRKFLRSLIAIGKSAIPHAVIRYALGKSENVYLRPEWWEQIDGKTREYLVGRVKDAVDLSTPIREGALIDDGVRIVNWDVSGFDSNVPELTSAWDTQCRRAYTAVTG